MCSGGPCPPLIRDPLTAPVTNPRLLTEPRILDATRNFLYILYMTQINLHVTPEFEADLEKLMKDRGLRSKSEAIRLAVHEAAAAEAATAPKLIDWSELMDFVRRLPQERATNKTSEELLAEIDDEMEAKLDRLSRGIYSK